MEKDNCELVLRCYEEDLNQLLIHPKVIEEYERQRGITITTNLEGCMERQLHTEGGVTVICPCEPLDFLNDPAWMKEILEVDECKGNFTKKIKGKHTYPHWYKGK